MEGIYHGLHWLRGAIGLVVSVVGDPTAPPDAAPDTDDPSAPSDTAPDTGGPTAPPDIAPDTGDGSVSVEGLTGPSLPLP